LQDATFFKAVGCEECSQRGFKGRVGLYEMLTLNDELRDMIVRHVAQSEVTQAAIACGMTTLIRDGLNKVKAGMTTVEEVLRVVTSH